MFGIKKKIEVEQYNKISPDGLKINSGEFISKLLRNLKCTEIVCENYDKLKEQAVIRASICTGEQVAGFKDRETGRFREVMLIRSETDRAYFLKKYGVQEEDLVKEY